MNGICNNMSIARIEGSLIKHIDAFNINGTLMIIACTEDGNIWNRGISTWERVTRTLAPPPDTDEA
jgi:hypothetical protein